MGHLSPGRAIVAGLFVGTGAAVAAVTLIRPGVLTADAWDVRSAAVAVAGVLALAVGFVLFGRAFQPPPSPAPSIPAHVAFSQRASVDPMALPQREAVASKPVAKLSGTAPALGTPRPTAATAADDPDEQIRELTRRINRAGVMLATGKLSGEGYAKYVEDLKRQRSQIEASKAHREFYGTRSS
jgi:hypothetical protein